MTCTVQHSTSWVNAASPPDCIIQLHMVDVDISVPPAPHLSDGQAPICRFQLPAQKPPRLHELGGSTEATSTDCITNERDGASLRCSRIVADLHVPSLRRQRLLENSVTRPVHGYSRRQYVSIDFSLNRIHVGCRAPWKGFIAELRRCRRRASRNCAHRIKSRQFKSVWSQRCPKSNHAFQSMITGMRIESEARSPNAVATG